MSPLPTVAHVRRPDLPWRVSDVTECNLSTDAVADLIDRPTCLALIANVGMPAASETVCTRCLTTTMRWPDFDTDPVGALGREFYGPSQHPQLNVELRALAALVDACRPDFDAIYRNLTEQTAGDEVAAARARRADRKPPR